VRSQVSTAGNGSSPDMHKNRTLEIWPKTKVYETIKKSGRRKLPGLIKTLIYQVSDRLGAIILPGLLMLSFRQQHHDFRVIWYHISPYVRPFRQGSERKVLALSGS
jgi:hypothetical protein